MWFLLMAVAFLLWLVCLFLVVVDSISTGSKVLWVLALTVLAPIAIPVYLVLRLRRGRASAPAHT